MRSTAKTALFVILLLPAVCFSQFRKYSNEFLNIGAGARGLAMGSAQIATASDATAGYWNPAGLTGVKDNPNLNLMHAEYFAGIAKYDYAALAIPVADNKRTIGISVLRFAVDEIPNTLNLFEPDGSINYNQIKTFAVADWAALFSFAQNIKQSENRRVSFGANAKIIYRKVGSFATAWGFGLDAGLQIHGKKGHFGVVAKDLTTTFNAWSFKFTDEEKEKLFLTKNEIPVQSTELTAPRVSVGGGYTFGKAIKVTPEASLDITFDGKRNTVISSNPISIDPHVGVEVGIKDVFFIRGGVTNFQKALADGDTLNQKKVWIYQPSAGAGFKIKNVMVDYAYTNLANQNNPLYTHIVSLRVNLIKKEKN